MVLELRSFRNTDILALCGVFNAHYHAAGLPYVLTPISLELCVLSKPYFTSEQLLIAEVDGSIHAFALLGLEPDQDCNSVDPSLATLCALCAHPNATDSTVMELLQHASRSAQAMGSKRITFCPPPPSSAYFAGLVPGDGMIGVPEVDIRQTRWFAQAQWQPTRRIDFWELELANFHPPMDRTQIQLRRTAQVERLIDEPLLPWYVASMLGHADPIAFELQLKSSNQWQSAIFWTVSQELVPQLDIIARLWPIDTELSSITEDQWTYLLAESLRQLQSDRVDRVVTVAEQVDSGLTRILRRLGFQSMMSGTVHALVKE